MSLAGIWETGYDSIKDDPAQKHYKSVICECRKVPGSYLDNMESVFIPNDQFMLDVFGSEILEYGCYFDGSCYWNNSIIFPITDVLGTTCGFVGFNPFKYTSGENDYYTYSPKSVCVKSNFLYLPGKKLDVKRPLFIVDGVWDAIALHAHGFQAGACMGSVTSEILTMLLRACKKVIVCPDNDEPGTKLLYRIRKRVPEIGVCRQAWGKDVDEALKTNHELMLAELSKASMS